MIPDDNLCDVTNRIHPSTIRHIAKYPFAHSEREVYEYFRQLHSAFVVREVRYSFDGNIVDIFCSFECANYFNQEYFVSNLVNLQFNAIHIMFKDINVLQTYCQRRRCIVCRKYTTVCDNRNLYAEPTEDYVIQVFPINNYTDNLLRSTVHT
ncbi:unnamed protein product [Macrosiphum euphorbiae]|uniref:Uncharacterized protein n=1 Tax=Macrosiphum euphorbiae TaxID=13131 RepID=A0AAV0XRP0_9HEMI|nr:unnamed protein product [Macrosiphum euphorbiae]CAI6376443.1 unnamed protein product [Macrosiphum euphorbiae]